jgi:ABC-type multidrug transport system ATPase subunit
VTSAANPSGAAVALKDVTKHFGRFAALRAITAEFAPACLYAVLGDNGAGKSTMLRAIAGLSHITRGEVRLFGHKPAEAKPDLGYMAHAPLLYEELDAVENMLYFAQLYGITDRTRCEAAIRQVGLDPLLNRRVGQYSQGMRQRLSLARAIIHDPKILLLDEPFSNVDIHSAREMVELLGRMRDGGRTIFVVTHQPSLLEGVADEFVMMSQGRIVDRTRELTASAAETAAFRSEVQS